MGVTSTGIFQKALFPDGVFLNNEKDNDSERYKIAWF